MRKGKCTKALREGNNWDFNCKHGTLGKGGKQNYYQCCEKGGNYETHIQNPSKGQENPSLA